MPWGAVGSATDWLVAQQLGVVPPLADRLDDGDASGERAGEEPEVVADEQAAIEDAAVITANTIRR